MKTTVSISISEEAEILVKIGEEVSEGSLLAQKCNKRRETVSLCQIFKVPAEKIKKFIKKNEGDKVGLGEILAVKRSLFSQLLVKSPMEGKIEEVNIYRGSVTIACDQEKRKVASPVSGKVKEIGKDKIVIEFSGRIFEGKKGEGKAKAGLLSFLSQGSLDSLNLSGEIRGKIILGEAISKTGLAKAEALDVSGLVLGEEPPALSLPFLIFEKETLRRLAEFSGNMVILDGDDKRLIVPFR